MSSIKGPVLEGKELCDEELKNNFPSLKSNKSPGYDGISSNIINSVSEEILDVLKHVLKLLINQGVLKITCVAPIFENGDEYLLTNYRLISVLPCFSKIPERIMYNRIYDFLTNKLAFLLHIQQNMEIYNFLIGFLTLNEKQFTLGVFIDFFKSL